MGIASFVTYNCFHVSVSPVETYFNEYVNHPKIGETKNLSKAQITQDSS